MESIGAEVGLKMRSAIKAKLLELNCYVDDELPDYIMVMVANKRSKSQMNEDLKLFLSTKTSQFVDWLHIVLKKLREVTVTNPDVYRKVEEKKSENIDATIKKENKIKLNIVPDSSTGSDQKPSLTDNLLIRPSRCTDQGKVSDNFDIPLLSQVPETQQVDVNKIKGKVDIKSRLGQLVESDEETPTVKTEGENSSTLFSNRTVELQYESRTEQAKRENEPTQKRIKPPEKRKHTPIIFEKEEPPRKKISILDRLGKKTPDIKSSTCSEFRKEENKILDSSKERDNREERMERGKGNRREYIRSHLDRDKTNTRRDSFRINRDDSRRSEAKTVLSRVISTIHVPVKDSDEHDIENKLKTREVRSMVQVKPRVIPPNAQQPNKNLLLKAVAEAHRSVAQTTKVGQYNFSPKKQKITERIG